MGAQNKRMYKISGGHSKIYLLIILGIITIFAIGLFALSQIMNNSIDKMTQDNNTSNEASIPVRSEPAPQSNPLPSTDAGIYKVGTDLAAGEYRLVANGGNGYVEVATDSTGTLESIVTNSNFSTNAIVTIRKGQYFKFERALAYPINKSPTVDVYKEGTFKVGKDLPAGEYKIASTEDSGYVQVSRDSLNTFDSIVSNDNFEGNSYITVTNGQYLTLTRAHIVK